MTNTLRNIVAGTILGASAIAGSLGLEGCSAKQVRDDYKPVSAVVDYSRLSDSELDGQLSVAITNLYEKVKTEGNRADFQNFSLDNSKMRNKKFGGKIIKFEEKGFLFRYDESTGNYDHKTFEFWLGNRQTGSQSSEYTALKGYKVHENKELTRKQKETALQILKQISPTNFYQ